MPKTEEIKVRKFRKREEPKKISKSHTRLAKACATRGWPGLAAYEVGLDSRAREAGQASRALEAGYSIASRARLA